MQDHIMPIEDQDISAAAQKAFKKQGIHFHTGSTVADAQDFGQQRPSAPFVRRGEDLGGTEVDADVVLVAIGVETRVDGVFRRNYGRNGEGLHQARLPRRSRTHVRHQHPGVYAAGDCIGPPWLAAGR